jgi:hypothetical protein
MISNDRFFTLSSETGTQPSAGDRSSNYHIGSFKDTIRPLANAFK